MSTVRLFTLSELTPGRYYEFIQLRSNLSIHPGHTRFVSDEQILMKIKLGKLLKIDIYGRPYDPEVLLHFEHESGTRSKFEPMFVNLEHYAEYDPPDNEEDSKQRILERTRVVKYDILANDWALRPENVVATQGIDITRFRN
jgi:hypothetical protein